MKGTIELSLGRESLDYIREQLSVGHTLSSTVLSTCDLEPGSVTTFMPDGISLQQAREFTTGGKLPPADPLTWVSLPEGGIAVPIPSVRDLLPRKVHEYLQAGRDRIWLFEDFNASPSDPVMKQVRCRYVSLGNEVYYPLDHNSDEEAIREAANHAYSFVSFIGAGARLSPAGAERFSRVNEIEEGDLQRLVSGLDLLTVGAYDGEGFLLWRRSGTGDR
jgi:hypothetical protein